MSSMTRANQEKRKYEESNLSFHRGSVFRRICIAGIDIVCAKAPTTAISKVEAISQQLDLTPQQKLKFLPILRDELPKVRSDQKRQFALKDAESATDQSHSSAD